jgi:hypothetical protein
MICTTSHRQDSVGTIRIFTWMQDARHSEVAVNSTFAAGGKFHVHKIHKLEMNSNELYNR